MKIATIGTGNLGCSVAKDLINTDAITSLYLTKRNMGSVQNFVGHQNVYLTRYNREAMKYSDMLIFDSRNDFFFQQNLSD